MGNLEEVLEIPAEMERVVRIHQGQPYERYYSGLAEMVRLHLPLAISLQSQTS
jgi:hypothetical protein